MSATRPSPLDDWQRSNDACLGAALEVLRLRLLRLAGAAGPRAPAEAAGLPAAAAVAPARPLWSFMRRAPEATAAAPAAPPVPLLPAPDEQAALQDAERRRAEAWAAEPAPALRLLCERLGLGDFEREVLLLAVAPEFDTRMPALFARVQDDGDRVGPSFALAMTVFDEPVWEATSPERPLRFWRLVEHAASGAGPLTTRALRADERIVNFVKGLNHLDERLAPLLVPMAAVAPESLPPSQAQAVQQLAEASHAADGNCAVLTLRGRDRESCRRVAAATARSLGLHLYRLVADALPTHPADLETLARLWHRESLLLPLALYIDAREHDGPVGVADSPQQRVARFVARTGGLVIVDGRDPLLAALEPAATAEVDKPTAAEQQAAWSAGLGTAAGAWPALLAGQFNLSQHDIATVAAEARLAEPEALGARLWQGCRARTRPGLDRLAEKIEAKADWSRMVLPEAETAQLRQLAAQARARSRVYDEWGFRAVMNRGLGISALFAGESGTGKTMAAEVLARDLDLDLYRIDLSAVVSKYIGETEKNLRQVFDAAEDGGAILLFDEADALFGKRSEVKDSHDRYANIEINYLLQRMEAYRGLALLATNMKSALDPAFVRRLRFIVNFSFPGVAERRRIWERAFPPGVPVGVLDYERLARLSLTGGNVHGIAVNAAFLAAEAGTPITMPMLLEAARQELRKLERPVSESDLRWSEPQGARA